MDKIQALRILGLQEGCSQEDVKKQFRKLAKENHPDLKGDSYNSIFIEINEAYKILMEEGTGVRMKLTHKSIFEIVRV